MLSAGFLDVECKACARLWTLGRLIEIVIAMNSYLYSFSGCVPSEVSRGIPFYPIMITCRQVLLICCLAFHTAAANFDIGILGRPWVNSKRWNSC